MEYLRVRNLRSITDSSNVQLKPLTILIGQNGIGKSTFARTFPLLKQSVEQNSTGALLYYGDYVDFGSFGESVKKDSLDDTISIDFGVKIPIPRTRGFGLNFFRKNLVQNDIKEDDIGISISVNALKSDDDLENTFVSDYSYTFLDHSVSIKSSYRELKSLEVNGIDLSKYFQDTFVLDDDLIPQLFFEENERLEPYEGFSRARNKNNSNDKDLSKRLVYLFKRMNHGRTSESRIMEGLLGFPFFRRQGLYRSIRSNSDFTDTFKNNIKNTKSRLLEEFEALLFLSHFFAFRLEILRSVKSKIGRIRYVAPLRAVAQRFYRNQNLSIQDLDHTGENLPMYLANLNSWEFGALSKWIKENFEFDVKLNRSVGHISVFLRQKESDDYFNIADMGFGFSQLFPIVVQLWHSVSRKDHFPDDLGVLVVEQPELHLHPKYQSLLAKSIINILEAMASEDSQLKIVIETHSDHFIQALGEAVGINPQRDELINLVLFEKRESSVVIRQTKFDQDGFIEDWPFGFMS